MFSTGRFRPVVALALILCCGAPALAQTPSNDVSLYRVFLNDGSTLLSFGEFARVGDKVIVSVPLGAVGAEGTPPTLHLLSIPSDTVDWEKTDAYADSVRATRYAATRGPDDLAMLGDAVTRALSDIAATPDPARKIAMAAEARQNVTKWAAEHYGYQAQRVAEMASLFDNVVAETRAQGGAVNVDLSLVANMAAPPAVPLLPPPTFEEHLEQAYRAAALSPEATERLSLLHAIEHVLGEAAAARPGSMSPLYTRVRAAVATEERANRAYEGLTRDMMRSADRYAQSADVTGVERVIRRTLAADDRLGQRRPQEMAALLATLDVKLDAARRLRLAQDNWTMRSAAVRTFRTSIGEPLSLLQLSRNALDQIKRYAGPSPELLERLATRMVLVARQLAAISVPAEGASVHAMLKGAAQFAARAADSRLRAVASREMLPAQEASSAAAGALMFLERAAEELKGLTTPPVQAPR